MRACVISSAERIRSCVLTNAFSDIPARVQGVERGDGRDRDRKDKGDEFKVRRGKGNISVDSGCQHI